NKPTASDVGRQTRINKAPDGAKESDEQGADAISANTIASRGDRFLSSRRGLNLLRTRLASWAILFRPSGIRGCGDARRLRAKTACAHSGFLRGQASVSAAAKSSSAVATHAIYC